MVAFCRNFPWVHFLSYLSNGNVMPNDKLSKPKASALLLMCRVRNCKEQVPAVQNF